MNPNLRKSLILALLFLFHTLEAKTIYYKQLSKQFDLEVSVRLNTTNNPYLDSTYLRIRIFEKGSKMILQTIRKPIYSRWHGWYTDLKNSRSYSTHYNEKKPVIDDDFGDVVVADLNFDGLDDFAVTYDHGADNGNHYYFYFQRPNKTFYRQVYLTENMVHFPYLIDPIRQQLITRTAAGACCVGERIFQYSVERNSWVLHSSRVLE